jgi:hypothetical protein
MGFAKTIVIAIARDGDHRFNLGNKRQYPRIGIGA